MDAAFDWADCFLPGGLHEAICAVAQIFAGHTYHELHSQSFACQSQSGNSPAAADFSSFPIRIDGWVGSHVALLPEELAVLGKGDFLVRDYTRGTEIPMNPFLAYYPHSVRGTPFIPPEIACRALAGLHYKLAKSRFLVTTVLCDR